MAVFKCEACGAALECEHGASVIKCKYCGAVQTVPEEFREYVPEPEPVECGYIEISFVRDIDNEHFNVYVDDKAYTFNMPRARKNSTITVPAGEHVVKCDNLSEIKKAPVVIKLQPNGKVKCRVVRIPLIGTTYVCVD